MSKFNRGWIWVRRDVEECSRCGGRHPDLLFRRVRNGAGFGVRISHFATCPTTGEPIVLLSKDPKPPIWTWATTGNDDTSSSSTTLVLWPAA